MSRPEWTPAAEDGITWTRTRPIPRGLGEGAYGAGLSQLCRWLNWHSVAPWEGVPDPPNIDAVPDAPIQAAYLQYLRDSTDDVRAVCLLDEWTWVYAIAGAPIGRDLLTEYRRAIPVANNTRATQILGASRFFADSSHYMLITSVATVYRDSVSAGRRMILCDFAAGERMANASVSAAIRIEFVRTRNNTGVAWPVWPEPVSLRYIPASAIPDQEWDDSHAATLFAYIGGATELGTVSRSDLAGTDTAGSTTTSERAEGWARVQLPAVPGSGKFWLGLTVPGDGSAVADGGVSATIRTATPNRPTLYWSEPPA